MTARVAMWLVFVLTAGALFGSIQHEAQIREEQLCGVVVNVHNNDLNRSAQSQHSLRVAKEYLADPESKAESPALYRRIQETLPQTKERVKLDKAAVKATTVPPVCERYKHKES